MSKKPKNYVFCDKTTKHFYSVSGWTPTTHEMLLMAVIFPDNMLAEPKGRNWKRVAVKRNGRHGEWELENANG
jgi:hypothetical protein